MRSLSVRGAVAMATQSPEHASSSINCCQSTLTTCCRLKTAGALVRTLCQVWRTWCRPCTGIRRAPGNFTQCGSALHPQPCALRCHLAWCRQFRATYFGSQGLPGCAVAILLGFHALLRTGGVLMAAAGDIKISPTCCHLHLRETKICQRLAFNELVSVENDYLR